MTPPAAAGTVIRMVWVIWFFLAGSEKADRFYPLSRPIGHAKGRWSDAPLETNGDTDDSLQHSSGESYNMQN